MDHTFQNHCRDRALCALRRGLMDVCAGWKERAFAHRDEDVDVGPEFRASPCLGLSQTSY